VGQTAPGDCQGRTSCHRWWPNQLRLLLSSLAYILLEAIRRLALQGTELARAQCGTICLKLLKIGAVVVRNARRVRLILSSGYPLQALFFPVAARLASGQIPFFGAVPGTRSTTRQRGCVPQNTVTPPPLPTNSPQRRNLITPRTIQR